MNKHVIWQAKNAMNNYDKTGSETSMRALAASLMFEDAPIPAPVSAALTKITDGTVAGKNIYCFFEALTNGIEALMNTCVCSQDDIIWADLVNGDQEAWSAIMDVVQDILYPNRRATQKVRVNSADMKEIHIDLRDPEKTTWDDLSWFAKHMLAGEFGRHVRDKSATDIAHRDIYRAMKMIAAQRGNKELATAVVAGAAEWWSLLHFTPVLWGMGQRMTPIRRLEWKTLVANCQKMLCAEEAAMKKTINLDLRHPESVTWEAMVRFIQEFTSAQLYSDLTLAKTEDVTRSKLLKAVDLIVQQKGDRRLAVDVISGIVENLNCLHLAPSLWKHDPRVNVCWRGNLGAVCETYIASVEKAETPLKHYRVQVQRTSYGEMDIAAYNEADALAIAEGEKRMYDGTWAAEHFVAQSHDTQLTCRSDSAIQQAPV